MNRRDSLQRLKLLGLLSLGRPDEFLQNTLLTRPIPSTGERLPAVGVGTWQTFDIGNTSDEREPLKAVLKTLLDQGGTVVDSSPMYGRSEKVVGDLSHELKVNHKLFIATKVWTNGRDNGLRQMTESLRLMGREQIELMQIHNLVDWQIHLKTLRTWKEEGKIKYIGLTHYTSGAHERLASIISTEKIDFIQINYNLLDRHAEERLLPLARERGVAVLINQPFESGTLFGRVKGKQVPSWAKEFDCQSWAQFFLKFILAHPSVTCVIPGTAKPHHMLDNMGAGFGRLPNDNERRRMIAAV